MCEDHPTMTTAEIRSAFLTFFEERGCKAYPSSSLIPDDPSLLLANAGMNQFKEYYQGKRTMHEIGACSCQKCVRTNDIDVIGSDGRHLSFFEMLGNFSFGGVSKAQACAWAYELICDVFKLDPSRLYFTVFTDDDEAYEIWCNLGVTEDHISRLGEDDNFWAAGPTGPCGPCSEIYYDQGEAIGCGEPTCAPGCDCDRYLEFWNLVFTQFDRQEDGSMPELPHRNLDTGMGLERMAAIMQRQGSNYEGDLMRDLIDLGSSISGKSYDPESYEGPSRSLRIIADAARAVDFLIADGVLPGNEGRGYVLRRLLRRAVFHGRLIGIEGAFLGRMVDEVNRLMGDAYPELVENAAVVAGIVAAEEQRFSATLESGRAYLAAALQELAPGDTLDGAEAFKLHDTFGFPIDLTQEIAHEAGYEVDMPAFDAAMAAQRSRARAAAQGDAWGSFNDVWTTLADELVASEFLGYEESSSEACCVTALVAEGERVHEATAGQIVDIVLDRTPFYAERGGQVGDTGELLRDDLVVEVLDTQAKGDLIVHHAQVQEGSIQVGDCLCAAINERRRALIRRNHTATHLLDAALKAVLGEHVSQAGSLVDADRLRFDFTHFEAVSQEQLRAIQDMINEEILAAKPVLTRLMDIEAAKASGAVALFGEKYGEEVRVVSVGAEEHPFSRELCGGTHVENSSEIGVFKIVSESSAGSNVRRIEAMTSLGALAYLEAKEELVAQVSTELKSSEDLLVSRIHDLKDTLRATEQKLRAALVGGSSDRIQHALDAAIDLGAYKLIVARLDGLDGKELRSAWDALHSRDHSASLACVLASASPDNKAALLAAATDEAVAAGFHAGELIREIAACVDGRGGGRPAMAQAGGSDVSGIDAALAAATDRLRAS
ncbi:alanine--tRNA ligase [Collinsella sp. AGMB00827]|uniref:Alanine--tRNA ligase n=1 Tax=Collinsella ureilytica TaxID=2869515 RepID=A0ABS7MLE4_9ACTN|nr:alanine--tRNA ligase [Collinsella urealyticum]MBY4798097.1 alanine--tRNA ligase [Collinsella urealyticum]